MLKILLPFFTFSLIAFENTSTATLYKSLDPLSVNKHLTFYKLYPDTDEGKKALNHAWQLLFKQSPKDISIPNINIHSLIQIINEKISSIDIAKKDLEVIENLCCHLKNRQLKTFGSLNEKDFLQDDEIDLARGLFLTQFGSDETKIKYYEACLDLITLQIEARLPQQADDITKIKAINQFIFFEMGFKFPPLSSYSKEVDSYTFLPSVIDSRKGVCLGISILYLCIAQRLGLTLEAITIPGHIFVKHKEVNIETTARGIHIPTEDYLGIEIKDIKTRTLKEVIALAFINEASLHLGEKNFEKAKCLYEKAQKYLPEDFLLKQLLGCCYLFTNKKKEGKALLKTIKKDPCFLTKDTLADDYLNNRVDIEGLKAIFIPYDKDRNSLINKKNELEKIIKKYPSFKAGLMLLANIWLELGRVKEAGNILNKYFEKDPEDLTVNFYLSQIAFQRKDFLNSWKHLKICETFLKDTNYYPKVLKIFKENLNKNCLDI